MKKILHILILFTLINSCKSHTNLDESNQCNQSNIESILTPKVLLKKNFEIKHLLDYDNKKLVVYLKNIGKDIETYVAHPLFECEVIIYLNGKEIPYYHEIYQYMMMTSTWFNPANELKSNESITWEIPFSKLVHYSHKIPFEESSKTGKIQFKNLIGTDM